MTPDGCPVLVFAKAPVAGRVKTRLIPELGAERARDVYEHLLHRTVRLALESGVGPVSLWCAPDAGHPVFQLLSSRYPVGLARQMGADLGERMARALALALEGADRAVLIGSDCADLTADDLREASAALARGSDAVLGPAVDGGYVLIGVRRPGSPLFVDVPWSTDRVLAVTRERLTSAGWSWHELAPRHDVDLPADLRYLPEGWNRPDAR
jgi:rSAM/selenodomain-associated transferase 1